MAHDLAEASARALIQLDLRASSLPTRAELAAMRKGLMDVNVDVDVDVENVVLLVNCAWAPLPSSSRSVGRTAVV